MLSSKGQNIVFNLLHHLKATFLGNLSTKIISSRFTVCQIRQMWKKGQRKVSVNKTRLKTTFYGLKVLKLLNLCFSVVQLASFFRTGLGSLDKSQTTALRLKNFVQLNMDLRHESLTMFNSSTCHINYILFITLRL